METKTELEDTTLSSDGKPDITMDAADDPLNTLEKSVPLGGVADEDTLKTEKSHLAPNTPQTNIGHGTRIESLAGLNRASNVNGVMYVEGYTKIEIAVTFGDGVSDKKIFMGDAVLSVGIILFGDKPLSLSEKRFYEIESPT